MINISTCQQRILRDILSERLLKCGLHRLLHWHTATNIFLDEQHSSYVSEGVLSFPPQVADEISKDEMNQNQLFFLSIIYSACSHYTCMNLSYEFDLPSILAQNGVFSILAYFGGHFQLP